MPGAHPALLVRNSQLEFAAQNNNQQVGFAQGALEMTVSGPVKCSSPAGLRVQASSSSCLWFIAGERRNVCVCFIARVLIIAMAY